MPKPIPFSFRCTDRDLKSGNVLCDSVFHPRNVKICDFGTSYTLKLQAVAQQEPSTSIAQAAAPFYGGTVGWTAPEVLRSGRCVSSPADVYSFGIVVWELMCLLNKPYGDNMPRREIIEGVTNGGLRPAVDAVGCKHPASTLIHNGLKQLYLSCVDGDPEARPPFESIVSTLTSLEATAKLEEMGRTPLHEYARRFRQRSSV